MQWRRPVAARNAQEPEGQHGRQIRDAVVEQGKRDLVQVQADELRVTGRTMMAGMGVATLGGGNSASESGVGRRHAPTRPSRGPKTEPAPGLDRRRGRLP